MPIHKSALLALLLAAWTPSVVSAQQPSTILEIGDDAARKLLNDMAAKGNLKLPMHAEAWVVTATVALGMGLEKCGLPKPGDDSMWTPALETMSPEQVMVLNRMVTANFRKAEKGNFVDLDKLFPVTRQVALSLSDDKAKWNCSEIAGVWAAAANYSTANR